MRQNAQIRFAMKKREMVEQFIWRVAGKALHFVLAQRKIRTKCLLLAMLFLTWTSPAQAIIPASERAVLNDLYQLTHGASWSRNANWNGPAGTECDWQGVQCDWTQEHVAGLSLADNNLAGKLPSSIGGLANLKRLHVSGNRLTGSIPPLRRIAGLRHFAANDNRLTGSIPSLEGMSALESLDVSRNQLTGAIPLLDGLAELRWFSVASNKLTGSMPSLGGLTSLASIDVSGNQLTGTIPSLRGLTALRHIDVRRNRLTGSIPAIAGLTALEGLDEGGGRAASPFSVVAGAAAGWVKLRGNEKIGYYVLPAVIRSGDGRAEIWALHDHRIPRSHPLTRALVLFLSESRQVEYDCRQRQSRARQFRYYRKSMGMEEISTGSAGSAYGEWTPVESGTAAEDFWKFACAKQ
jgi:hypothetical protein